MIRAAIEGDIDGMAKVQAAAMAASEDYPDCIDPETVFRQVHPRICGYFAGTLHPKHSVAERGLFVADQEGSIVGFVAGHLSTRMGFEGELQWAFVHPEWQRQGLGSALVQSLASWFVEHDCTRVIVDAPPRMASRAFYMQLGAEPLDDYWLSWRDVSSILR